MTIAEDAEVGQMVGTIVANDDDKNVRDKTVEFNIVDGNGIGVFTLDKFTGRSLLR